MLPVLLLVSCSKEITPTTSTSSNPDVTIHYCIDGKEEDEISTIKGLTNFDTLIKTFFKDGYRMSGIYTDSTYKTYYDFSTQRKEYDLYVKYDKIESTPISEKIELTSYIDSLLDKTDSYIPSWNKESFKGRWNYIDGVFLKSIVNLYKKTNNNKYKDFFINYINYYINEDGTFIYYNNGKKIIDNKQGFKEGELDTVCESMVLFDAYELTNDERYIKAIEYTYQKLMEMPKAQGSNNFWHKTSYENQIWLDGMYMYAPFLARYAKYKNDDSLFDLLLEQYQFIYQNMKNDNNLLCHGFDTTKSIFWSKDNDGKSSSIWLRSIGWFLASIADTIEYLPKEKADALNNIYTSVIGPMIKYQDETTKMFYQVVDKKEAIIVNSSYFTNLKNNKYGNTTTVVSNYLESSGSLLIAYSLMRMKSNFFTTKSFVDAGKEIFEGVYSVSFKDNKLNDICITAGLGPDNKKYRDGSRAYYLAEPVGSDDAKGVGPFIMAYLEYNN